MRPFLFVQDLLKRLQEEEDRETDFLGFEAFTRPVETSESPETSSSDGKELPRAA